MRWNILRVVTAAPIVLVASAVWAGEGLPRTMAIGTNPAGSMYYAVGTALAKVLTEKSPIQVRVQPYAGTTAFIPLLNSGELEMGINNIHDLHLAYKGEKPFPLSPNVRNLSVLFPLRIGFVVRNDSPMRRVEDVKGKRVTGKYSAQLAVFFNTAGMLASANLTWDDITMVPVTNVNEGLQALMDGRTDVAAFALGAAKMEEANAAIPGGVRILAVNDTPAGAKRMGDVMYGSYPLRVKPGITGVREEIPVMAYDSYLTTSTATSDAAALEIVKALWNNVGQIQGNHPILRAFNQDSMVKANTSVPYHAGAAKFYREHGKWSDAMETAQRTLLKGAPR